MTPDQNTDARCPRCGEAAIGRFCTGCGGALRDVACTACGSAATPGALHCSTCGVRIGAAAAGARRVTLSERLPRLIGGAALLALAVFVAGVMSGRRLAGKPAFSQSTGVQPVDAPEASPGGMGAPTATDISAMSPEERASRLFNRVMSYSEQGKMDSARFFAPMAIQAYQMLGPTDAHMRYDIGVISAAVGDVARARAEADTILAARPNHLLGLVLAARTAGLAGDAAGQARLRRQLAAAAPTERSALKEYAEHARDIDESLRSAGAGPR